MPTNSQRRRKRLRKRDQTFWTRLDDRTPPSVKGLLIAGLIVIGIAFPIAFFQNNALHPLISPHGTGTRASLLATMPQNQRIGLGLGLIVVIGLMVWLMWRDFNNLFVSNRRQRERLKQRQRVRRQKMGDKGMNTRIADASLPPPVPNSHPDD